MKMLHRAVRTGKRFENPVPTAVGGFSMALKVLPLYFSTKEERTPRDPLGPFRTDGAIYNQASQTGLRVTWMGHSSMLIEIDGLRVLVDPVWDERASPFSWMGPKRFFAAPLKLEDLPRIDVLLVSHDHYDHLGKETIRRLAGMACAENARWITSLGVGAILTQFGVSAGRIDELDWTQTTRVAGPSGAALEITSVPTRHFSGRSAFNRFETLWAAFVLRGAKHRLYFGADSGWWDGFPEIAEAYGPFDLTMLEIGAFNELWKEIHLGPDGALRAFEAMGGRGVLMPIHWGLFDLALHAWRQPIERLVELADANGVKLWAPEPGRPTEFQRGVEMRSEWWRRCPPGNLEKHHG